MKSAPHVILALYLLKEALGVILLRLNLSHMRKTGPVVPPEFSGIIDTDLLTRAQDYAAEKTSFAIVSSGVSVALTTPFIFGGLLHRYDAWTASLGLSFVSSGWLFFTTLAILVEVLSIPLSLYSTFRIENRYGFNRMTLGLWVADFVKSLLLSIALMSIVLVAGLWIIQSSPLNWWLWAWGFFLFFSVFVMYLSPYVIEPLFNTFTPLADEGLREDVAALARKAGIRVGRILKVDASRRSRHTNAYFAGIGRTKRIVLFDTLLERLSPREILAVLAHEIGHWKKKHLLKTIFLFEAISLAGLFLAHRLIGSDLVPKLFGIPSATVNAKITLVAFLAGIALAPLRPLACYLSRRHEREADRYSQDLTGEPESMVSALVKLSRDNLSNLYPHRLYVAFSFTHPPVLERVRLIRERTPSLPAEKA